jgi:hypothetical protein
MNDEEWLFRTYDWKGASNIAVYRGRRRLGTLIGSVAIAHELAKALRGRVIELGEVRETPTIKVKQWTVYEPFEIICSGDGTYPSTFAEVQEADASRPGWDLPDKKPTD